ncbi:COP9 signalosome complex subunit 1-like [Centruroides sculpturatus]|uniref:COP9 signalosome complex subunit 1-like n=1 Tax=Centruroides sculpturatus TaxID=218467 RepID=UPI000C6CB798|nr:COP9 signalosome complex subunit 1-like [Centruroides sculpturatus]
MANDTDIVDRYNLPPNSSYIICIHTIHHNPAVFQNPEVFDPDRFLPENCEKRNPFAFLPFCAGQRNCIEFQVSVYLQNWSHVLTYVNKAEATPEVAEGHGKDTNQQILTKLRCAAGLAELATKKYKSAAKNFLQASFDHCDFPDLLSSNNVAMYGGLCALASFDRQELLKNIISSRLYQ